MIDIRDDLSSLTIHKNLAWQPRPLHRRVLLIPNTVGFIKVHFVSSNRSCMSHFATVVGHPGCAGFADKHGRKKRGSYATGRSNFFD